jgi:CBS-domain-containing membrane protein
MTFALDRLESLRVGDIMNRDVVSVSAAQDMSAAAAVFVEHGISGAPVIDEQGRCVGVISAADFVRRDGAAKNGSISTACCSPTVVRQEPHGPWEIHDVFPDRVSAHMSSAVQAVAVRTPLVEAGRIMCAQHVHRLPVLDAHGRPQGMVTSLDLVAAVVQAVHEHHNN